MKIPFTNWNLKLQKLNRVPINSLTQGVFRMLGADQKTYIRDGYKINGNVYAVINWITKKASITHWHLFEINSQGEKEQVFKHDVLDLLNNPNPVQGKSEFIENLLGYKLIAGESFMHKLSPNGGINKGIPKELWILPPPIINVKFDKFGIPTKYGIQSGLNETTIESEDVLYMKYWNPSADDFRGMSPIEAGRKIVTQSNDAYTASMKLLQNLGAQGVLTVTDDNIDLTQTQIDDLESKYYEKYGGPGGYGKILVTGAKMTWQQIGLKATDLALIESQKMSLRDLCNLYNLSSQLFNDPDNKTFSNVKEARKSGISDVVIPEMELLLGELNRWLLTAFQERDQKEYILDFDKSIYPELKEDEERLSKILGTSWWMTPNERRNRMGLGLIEDEGMNELFIPMNLLPLGSSHEEELAKQYNNYFHTNGIETETN